MVGVTTITEVVRLPGCHVNEAGPTAFIEMLVPTQEVGVLLKVSGAFKTVTHITVASLQLPLIPVTV